MKTFFKTIMLLMCSMICAYAYGQLQPGIDYVPGQVFIKMKANRSSADKAALRGQMNANPLRTFENIQTELWTIDETQGLTVQQLVAQYRNHPDVEYVEPNFYYGLADYDNCPEEKAATFQTIVPSDTAFYRQWGLDNTGQENGTSDADINAPEGWDTWPGTTGSPLMKVAVIDTGIDWGHADLAENIWQNLGEDADGDGKVLEWTGFAWIFDPGDIDGIDNDGNGFADDFIGWDFVNNDNNPYDDVGHGTHVAGILGAKGDNTTGIAGVSWDVQLVALKVLDEDGNAEVGSIIDAVNYAVANDIPISNNSYGGGQESTTLEQAIQNGASNEHIFVASAGNENGNNNDVYAFYPASYNSNNIISVAAIDRNDNLASFSNYGTSSVHIGAPGEQILSCTPANTYNYDSGTSMSAPHVSGACAILWGLYHDRTATEIRSALLNSVVVTPALTDKCASDGRLDLAGALNYFGVAPPPPLPPPPPPVVCRIPDSLALVALFNANSSNTLGWDLAQPMSTWSGVTITNDCVTSLYLYNDGIDSLPAEIGNLSNLNSLNLGYSSITFFPSEMSNLSNLETLNLWYSNLTTLPVEITEIPNLKTLNLGNNALTSLPVEIGSLSNLRTLDLGGNDFISVPSEIGSLSNLETLDLGYNSLTSLPVEIGDLSNLEALYLYNNSLTSLPVEIGSLSNLEALYLYGNSLTSLPVEIGDLSNLLTLDIGSNSFTTIPSEVLTLSGLRVFHVDNNFLTYLPAEIKNLSNLYDLSIANNQLTSLLPEIGDLYELTKLSYQGNPITDCFDDNLLNLCGKIRRLNGYQNSYFWDPMWLDMCAIGTGLCNTDCRTNDSLKLVDLYYSTAGNYWTNPWYLYSPLDTWYGVELNSAGCVESINLTNNNLTGNIPSTIGDMSHLKSLNLSNNNLTGNIPIEIANLKQLHTLMLNDNFLENVPIGLSALKQLVILNLSDNIISGNLPPNFLDFKGLETLYLSNNFLSGEIPEDIGSAAKLRYLALDGNQLSGDIPHALGWLPFLEELYLHKNQLTGTIPYTFDHLTSIDVLWLYDNNLSGCFNNSLDVLCSRLTPIFSSNTFISNLNNFDNTWEDFCAGNITQECGATVYPGDFNYDGIADGEDALHWGLAYGNMGAPRHATPTTEWRAHDGEDWQATVLGVNGVHQDGDGSGVVDGADLQVLDMNFGNIHSYTPSSIIASTLIYRLEGSGSAGGNPKYDLYVEDVLGNPVSAHGFAFDLDLGALPVTGVDMDVSNSSLIPSDTLKVLDLGANKFHVALTRTDGVNQVCIGPVATFIIIAENVPTGDPFQLRVSSGTKIEADGTMDRVAGMSMQDTYPGNSSTNTFNINVGAVHAQCNMLGVSWIETTGGNSPYYYQWSTGETTDRIINLEPGMYQVTVSDSNDRVKYATIEIEDQYIPMYDEQGNLLDCIGAACPSQRTVDGSIDSGTYQAGNEVSSTGELAPGSDVEFKAGTIIKLEPGFQVPVNTDFSAEMEGCGNNN